MKKLDEHGSHTAIIGGGERYWEDKNMNKDICVRCGEGVVNIRVGAIIIKDNKVLIENNETYDKIQGR